MFEFSPAEWDAVRLSLKVGFWSVIVSLPVGFAFAYLLARATFPGKAARRVPPGGSYTMCSASPSRSAGPVRRSPPPSWVCP